MKASIIAAIGCTLGIVPPMMFASSVRNHLLARPRIMAWMRRAFAGAFVGLAAKLALTDR